MMIMKIKVRVTKVIGQTKYPTFIPAAILKLFSSVFWPNTQLVSIFKIRVYSTINTTNKLFFIFFRRNAKV